MLSRRSTKKKYITLAVIVLVLYVFLSSGYSTFVMDGTIAADPEKVWDFVSDFSNMKQLNPTILDFTITADGGNREHWQYSVEYVERLSHWPHTLNKNTGTISVKKVTKPNELFLIESETKTCFLFGLYCLRAGGLFEFSAQGRKGTFAKETVQYQCPPFLGRFCAREVEYQRQVIFANLKHHFNRNYSE